AFVDTDDYERLVERARSQERPTSAELRVAIREHLGESEPARDDRGTFLVHGKGGKVAVMPIAFDDFKADLT
ncbi:MAG TPA: hypothetical protein VEW90_04590, partial [Gaiellaceae bacterium]|nr:hypothetical protein [Gaiellaceae bacterium]